MPDPIWQRYPAIVNIKSIEDIGLINNALDTNGNLFYDSDGSITTTESGTTNQFIYNDANGARIKHAKLDGNDMITVLNFWWDGDVSGNAYFPLAIDTVLKIRGQVLITTRTPILLPDGVINYTGFIELMPVVNGDSDTNTYHFGSYIATQTPIINEAQIDYTPSDIKTDTNHVAHTIQNFRVNGNNSSGTGMVIKDVSYDKSSYDDFYMGFGKCSLINFTVEDNGSTIGGGDFEFGWYNDAYYTGQGTSFREVYINVNFSTPGSYGIQKFSNYNIAINVQVKSNIDGIKWFKQTIDPSFYNCYLKNAHFFDQCTNEVILDNCFSYQNNSSIAGGFGNKYNINSTINDPSPYKTVTVRNCYVIQDTINSGGLFNTLSLSAGSVMNLNIHHSYIKIDATSGFIAYNTGSNGNIHLYMKYQPGAPFNSSNIYVNAISTVNPFITIGEAVPVSTDSYFDILEFISRDETTNDIYNGLSGTGQLYRDSSHPNSTYIQTMNDALEFNFNVAISTFYTLNFSIIDTEYPSLDVYRSSPWIIDTYSNDINNLMYPELEGSSFLSYGDPHVIPKFGTPYDLPHIEGSFLLLDTNTNINRIIIKAKTWFTPKEKSTEFMNSMFKNANFDMYNLVSWQLDSTTFYKYVKIEYKGECCIVDMSTLETVEYNDNDFKNNTLPIVNKKFNNIKLTDVQLSNETENFEKMDTTHERIKKRIVSAGPIDLHLVSNNMTHYGNSGINLKFKWNVNAEHFSGALIRQEDANVIDF